MGDVDIDNDNNDDDDEALVQWRTSAVDTVFRHIDRHTPIELLVTRVNDNGECIDCGLLVKQQNSISNNNNNDNNDDIDNNQNDQICICVMRQRCFLCSSTSFDSCKFGKKFYNFFFNKNLWLYRFSFTLTLTHISIGSTFVRFSIGNGNDLSVSVGDACAERLYCAIQFAALLNALKHETGIVFQAF